MSRSYRRPPSRRARSNPFEVSDLTGSELRDLRLLRECIPDYLKLIAIQSEISDVKSDLHAEFQGKPPPEIEEEDLKGLRARERAAEADVREYLPLLTENAVQHFLVVPPRHDSETYLQDSLGRVIDLLMSQETEDDWTDG